MEFQTMKSEANDPSEPEGRDEQVMNLAWEDLTVMVPRLRNGGASKKLLNGLNGYALPGRIMAIMGPSGSGKTTLLDSLAGRLSSAVLMTGNVFFNGKKRWTESIGISYVPQVDVFLGTLTVKETITYSANLRLPTTMSKADINKVIEETITDMGLQDCAENRIGNSNLRGISSGEKKRLSLSVEILTRPHFIFLDEPTSSLDSASAFFVVQALRNIAVAGKVVVCSVHQPSSEVFHMFDDLLLLSHGEAVYVGEANMAIEFFAEAGFPCPNRRNPSEHFLRCISSGFDVVASTLLKSETNCIIPGPADPLLSKTTTEIKAMLIERYKCSEYSMGTRRKIQELKLIKEVVFESDMASKHTEWWKQLRTLTHRSFMNMSRDIGYYWLRIAFYVLISVIAGTIFFNVGNTYGAIIARRNCDAFIYGFMIFLSIGGLTVFAEEMKVFYRERSNRHYGEAVFVLSNFLSSLPFLVAMGLSSATIIYFMVKLHVGFSHYAYFCISLFSCIVITESCMMVVAALVPNVLMGFVAGIAVIGSMMASSGLYRPLPELPKFFWRYPMSYFSFTSWALEGQYKNDMIGLEFDPLVPGDPKLKGEIIVQTMYGIRLHHSKWWDLAVLVLLIVSYKVLFFMALKYKERVTSVLYKIYAKSSIQCLAKRPSARRERMMSSMRDQTLHPLYVTPTIEGLDTNCSVLQN